MLIPFPLGIQRLQLALGLIVVAVFGAACGDSGVARRSSVLLITVDTLRADHLGPYSTNLPGALPTPDTPHIDALAAEGVVFTNAAAPMPLTLPSHFSIFTSWYPREHGVMNNAMALPATVSSLPEIFAENGFVTGGFVSVSILDQAAGAARGFETFVNHAKPRERPAEVAIGDSLSWLETLPADAPFFAWVHLFDPHQPYGPPEAHRAGLDADFAERWPVLEWTHLRDVARENDGDIPVAVYEYARALYRAEVEYVDLQVGILLQGLADLGRRDNTIVVLTADHGEAFENGVYFEHADSLFDGAIRVPLIISHPAAAGTWPIPGTQVQEQVSSIDIAPTLLAAVGIEVPAEYSGRALQNAAHFGNRYVLIQHPFVQQTRAETHPHVNSVIRSVAGQPVSEIIVENERVGIVGADWKLLRTDDIAELYNRSVDPGERQDVASEEAKVLSELEAVLDRALADHPLTLIDSGEINVELRKTLEALGYLD
jgi:arylsulfatase A-like enzyme